ncbi:MAG: nitroreductase [Litorimonas sp.]
MTDMPSPFPFPARNDAVLDFLANRRSNLAKAMGGPGPSDEELDAILRIGTRVPDHRKLSPWRLTVYRGAARETFGQAIADAYRADNPDHPEDRHAFEAARFLRAPVVISVVSAPVDCVRGTPVWEQQMSAGAVCLKLCLAAQASGFGAQWLTEWYAYDPRIHAHMGLRDGEQVAGFIYLGTPTQPSSPRARPDLSDIVTHA